MNSDSSRAPGSAVPGFVISGLLGSDGPLLAARQLGLDRAVVVKRLDSDDPVAQARFQAEIGLLGLLEHPGIIPVYEAGRDADGRPFYALRHIRGRTWSPDGSEADLDILERVAEALAYAHHHGVAHGALAPERVVLGDHGEVLLTGWDAASRAPDARVRDAAALTALLARIRPDANAPPVADAAAFLDGLRHRRRLAAARRMADRARDHLAAAGADGDPGLWASARFAIAEALREDPSPGHLALASDIALAYAAAASARGDLGMAVAVLDPADPRQAGLARELSARLAARARRGRVLRLMAVAATIVLFLGAALLTTAMAVADGGRRRARTAEDQAQARRRSADADAYASSLAAVADHLACRQPDLARPLLAECADAQRGWEWRRLSWLIGRQLPELDQDGAGRSWPLAVDGGWIAAPHGATGIGLWRGAGRPERVLEFAQRPRCLDLAPDGGSLAAIDGHEVSSLATADGAVRWRTTLDFAGDGLLTLADGRILVYANRVQAPRPAALLSSTGAITATTSLPGPVGACDRDGEQALIACRNDRVYAVELGTDIVFRELLHRGNAMLPAVRGGIRPRLAFVAYGNGACGPVALDGDGLPWMGELRPVDTGVFSRDGALFAGMHFGGLSVFVRRCDEARPPRRIALPVPGFGLRITDDDRTLVAGCRDRVLLLPLEPGPPWQAAEGPVIAGSATATATAEDRAVRFAGGRTGDQLHAAAITAIAEADGRIFSGDAAGWLAVWDPIHARRLWHERIGTGPITAIAPGRPLRVRSGGQSLAVPDGDLAPATVDSAAGTR